MARKIGLRVYAYYLRHAYGFHYGLVGDSSDKYGKECRLSKHPIASHCSVTRARHKQT